MDKITVVLSMLNRNIRFLFYLFIAVQIVAAQNTFSNSLDEYVIKSIDEVSGEWVSYKADVFFKKSGTSIGLDFSMDETENILSHFEVITDWGKISIPCDILKELPSPQLDTISVSYVPKGTDKKNWSFSLRMYFGDYERPKNKEGDYSLAEFGFGKKNLLDVTVFDAKLDSSIIIYEQR